MDNMTIIKNPIVENTNKLWAVFDGLVILCTVVIILSKANMSDAISSMLRIVNDDADIIITPIVDLDIAL